MNLKINTSAASSSFRLHTDAVGLTANEKTKAKVKSRYMISTLEYKNRYVKMKNA